MAGVIGRPMPPMGRPVPDLLERMARWRIADVEQLPHLGPDVADVQDLYLAGMSIRQVGEVVGLSYEAVRRRLERSGTPRRGRGRAPFRPVLMEDGQMNPEYRLCIAQTGPDGLEPGMTLFKRSVVRMAPLRWSLAEVGMFDRDPPEGHYRDRTRDFAMPSGLPSVEKLMSQEGWHITRPECLAALAEVGIFEPRKDYRPVGREILARVVDVSPWPRRWFLGNGAQLHHLLSALVVGGQGDGILVV